MPDQLEEVGGGAVGQGRERADQLVGYLGMLFNLLEVKIQTVKKSELVGIRIPKRKSSFVLGFKEVRRTEFQSSVGLTEQDRFGS